MEFKIKRLKDSEVEAVIKITPEEFDKYQEKALKKIARETKLPGFRKGKVPVDMIREKVESYVILAELLDIALPDCYQQLCEENNLRPVSDVKPEILKQEPLEIKLTFSIWPKVTLADPKKLKTKKTEVKVSEADIKKEIEAIREEKVEWIEVERAAKDGDKVEIDFEGLDEKGEPLAKAKSENHPLVLGSNMMIPGFEKNVLGIKAGEEKEFDITFPKDYHSEQMKGKKAKFKVKAHHIFERKLPEWNDKFVEKATSGRIKKADELKKEIGKILEDQRSQLAKRQYEADLIAEFAEKSKLEVPNILVERVLDQMLNNFKHDIRHRGLTWDQYKEHHKITEDEIKKKWRDSAVKRAREEIVLQSYSEQEKIDAKEKEVNEEIELILNSIQDKEERKKTVDHYAKPEIRESVRAGLKLRKTIDKVIELQKKK